MRARVTRRLSLQTKERLLDRIGLWVFGRSRVPTSPFLEPDVFPWAAAFEEHWAEVRAELDALVDPLPAVGHIYPERTVIAVGDAWKSFWFTAYGKRWPPAHQRCPRTSALLEQVPDITLAFFSVLEPRTAVPPHRGPYRGVLRCHLGLRVPPGCGIEVGGETRHWEEGKVLVFDDGYIHRAWNDSAEARAVLFIDFLRPLPPFAAAVNRMVVWLIGRSQVIREGTARQAAWDAAYASNANTT